jgi:hypothetical protein
MAINKPIIDIRVVTIVKENSETNTFDTLLMSFLFAAISLTPTVDIPIIDTMTK